MLNPFTILALGGTVLAAVFTLSAPASATPALLSKSLKSEPSITPVGHDGWYEADDNDDEVIERYERITRRHGGRVYISEGWDDGDDVRVYERVYVRRGRADRHFDRYRDWDDDDEDDRRHVDVDAPFTHVYVGPRGRRVVAPFVDVWVPRD